MSSLRDIIEAQEVVNFVRKRLGKKMNIDDIAKALVEAALERGSVDNVTLIIIVFHVNSSSICSPVASMV